MLHKNNRNWKSFACHFGDDDIIIDSLVLNPVHVLPQGERDLNQEIDFYMYDNIGIYLLRVRNSNKNRISLVEDEENGIRYIVVEMKVKETFDALRKIVSELEKIPYSDKLDGKQQIYYYEK